MTLRRTEAARLSASSSRGWPTAVRCAGCRSTQSPGLGREGGTFSAGGDLAMIRDIVADPEVRATASGARVAKLSIATNRTFQDRTGQQQERTEWHRLTFFGRLADIVEQYVKKGDRIYAEGRIEYSQTQDEQGHTRYWTDIVVQEMVMLGSSGGDSGAGGDFARNDARSDSRPLSDPDDDLPF